MKKLTLILASIFAISSVAFAHEYGYRNVNSYADAFVFDEMGVTFSVYPDGEFDFYLADNVCASTASNGYVTATFNSGYNYDPYVQYDDFGAILQVENVPVYYDYYGRVSQIGDVFINYRNRRVCQVGGLYVHYDRFGRYARHTGFINVWNPYFVYRPFYAGFARPAANLCFVRTNPYRQFYRPVRYAYYRPYVTNIRPHFATIGHTYRPRGYGQVHGRYTQSARRGERAVVRSRRTITRADASPRPSSVNRGRVNSAYSTNNRASNRSSVANRSAGNRTVSTSRNSANVRSANSAVNTRRAVATQSRTTQTTPNRTRNNVVSNNRSVQPRTSNSASNRSVRTASSNRNQSTARQSSTRSTTRQSAPTRSTARTTQSRSSSPTRAQSSNRTNSRPQSTVRTSSSKSRTSVSPTRSSNNSRSSGKLNTNRNSSKKGR